MKASRLATIAAAVLALSIPVSGIASAPGEPDADKIRISFADLNIHNEAGARVLYGRLQRASELACSVDSYRILGSLERVAKTRQCYEETLDEFVAQVDSAALKKIHAG